MARRDTKLCKSLLEYIAGFCDNHGIATLRCTATHCRDLRAIRTHHGIDWNDRHATMYLNIHSIRYLSLRNYTGDQRPVNRLAVSRLAVDRLAVNRLAVNRLAVSRLAVSRLAVSRLAVNRLAVNRLAVDRLTVDRLPVNRLVGLSVGGTLRYADLVELIGTTLPRYIRCIKLADRFDCADFLARHGMDIEGICTFLLTQPNVSREWKQITTIPLSAGYKMLHVHESLVDVSDGLMGLIAGYAPNLRSLRLCASDLTDHGIKALRHLPLQILELYRLQHLTDTGIKWIGSIKTLRELTLYGTGTQCTEMSMRYIGQLDGLHRLGVDYIAHTSGESLGYLKGLDRLKYLDINTMYDLTDTMAQGIVQFSDLIDLGIGGCEKITSKGIELIASSLPKLQTIDASRCNIEPEYLQDIGTRFPQLSVYCAKEMTL